MARAKITNKNGYTCAPLGYRVEVFSYGAIVDGRVAEWAMADRSASAMFDPREETKVVAPSETKAMPKPRKKKGK